MVSLDSYSICDANCDETDEGIFLKGYTIAPQGITVIDQSFFKFSLNNDGDILELKHNSISVAKLSYGKYDSSKVISTPAQGKSIIRFSENELIYYKVGLPSRDQYNMKISYNNNIFINEVLPNPVGSDQLGEFVEIKLSDESDLSLWGWKLCGGAKCLEFPKDKVILAQSYDVIDSRSGLFDLLNDGISLKLIDPNDSIVSEVTYEKSIEGQSYSLLNSIWSWSKPTAGFENEFLQAINTPDNQSNSIVTAKEKNDGREVVVTGIITAPPQSLSGQYFYIQDQSSAIQIYCYKGFGKNLNEGDRIEVKGMLSSVAGERRIKVSDDESIIVINSSTKILPTEIKISEVGEPKEGEYVKIKGKVKSKNGATLVLSDSANSEVRVVLKNDLTKIKLKKGQNVEIAGIISQYKDYYRILPYKAEDVKIVTSDTLPVAGLNEYIYLVIAIIIFIIWNILPKVLKRPFFWGKNLPLS